MIEERERPPATLTVCIPPFFVHMNKNTITIIDPLTGVSKTVSPHDIMRKNKAMYGLWATVYGEKERGREK